MKFFRILPAGFLAVLLTWGVMVSQALSADDETLEEFLQKVEEVSASIKSFSCNFTQTKYLSIFPNPVKFKGRLSLVRPDKLRWEFVSPLPSVIVLNGNKGMKCGQEGPVREFALDRDPIMGMVAEQMWAWTSGSYRELRNDFEFVLASGSTLVFSPRREDMQSFIAKINVIFDPESLQPVEIEIIEPGGDRTVIDFFEYQRNLDLNNGLFTNCRPRSE